MQSVSVLPSTEWSPSRRLPLYFWVPSALIGGHIIGTKQSSLHACQQLLAALKRGRQSRVNSCTDWSVVLQSSRIQALPSGCSTTTNRKLCPRGPIWLLGSSHRVIQVNIYWAPTAFSITEAAAEGAQFLVDEKFMVRVVEAGSTCAGKTGSVLETSGSHPPAQTRTQL